MTYKVKFFPSALREWKKLAPPLQKQFKKKLEKIVENPHIPGSQLSGYANMYKIKLKSAGYRLVYEVNDQEIYIYVITIGKRSHGMVYLKMKDRNK